jgi:hypothetical protein
VAAAAVIASVATVRRVMIVVTARAVTDRASGLK